MNSYQPRWLICAQALGVRPEDLRGLDYISWNNRMVGAYIAEMGHPDRAIDHDHLTQWLADRTAAEEGS